MAKSHFTTNMKGFQQWMKRHPRRRTDGFFTFKGRELKHEEIKIIVDYAVSKGYKHDVDIPEDEIEKLLNYEKEDACNHPPGSQGTQLCLSPCMEPT